MCPHHLEIIQDRDLFRLCTSTSRLLTSHYHTVCATGWNRLSFEVDKAAHQYIQGVRNSSKDIEDFLQELAALTDVLRQLDVFLKKDGTGKRSFDQTSVLVKTYNACRSNFEKTWSTLQKRVNEARLLKALTWPFVGKEHQHIFLAILHWTHIFQFALTIEGCVLISKTAGEVSETLNNQLRILEERRR